MYKILLSSLLGLFFSTSWAQSPKGNLQKGDYGYLYCHMNDRGRAWTAYALSRDGFHYHDLFIGDSVFSDAEHARIEGATRDAYICRKHDGTGYLMVCTDMNVGAKERLGKVATWDNYGIDLLTSDDLISWRSAEGLPSSPIPRPRASTRTGRPSTACGRHRSCGMPITCGPTAERADI